MKKHRDYNETVGNHQLTDIKPRFIKKAANPLVRDSIYMNKQSRNFDDEDTKINDIHLNTSMGNNNINYRPLKEAVIEDSEEDKANIPKQTRKKKSFFRIFNIFAWSCKSKGKVTSPKRKTTI